MTFLSREISLRSGALVQLLKLDVRGTGYFLTSNDEAQVYSGDTYEPAPLTIVPPDSGSGEDGMLNFTLPADHALALALAPGTVTSPSAVTLFELHRGDAEAVSPFLGDVATTSRYGNSLVVTCRSLRAIEGRKLPVLAVARNCASMLYDPNLCQLVEDDWAYDAGTVTAIAGRVVTISGLAAFAGADATYFNLGVLKKAGEPMGFIVDVDGDDLTLLTAPPPDLIVTDAVRVTAGCDRLISTCHDRFGNEAHFAGVSVLPLRNPFTGRGLRP